MKSTIKISIVTPTLNAARFLPDTLNSISNQEGAFELQHVVLDGGSSDDTVNIIEEHANQISHWETGPDGGMYDSLCKGFDLTDGEIMGWINGDDVYFPWTLATITEIFLALPEVEWLSTLKPAAIDEKGHIFKIRNIAGFSSRAFVDGVYVGFKGLDNAYASDFIQQESTFWRRSLWERIGPDPIARYRRERRPAGDFALWALFAAEAELYGVETPLAGWRQHAKQWTEPVSYMDEVVHALGELRSKQNYVVPKFMTEAPTEYKGNYIVRSHGSWRTIQDNFFVWPRSDMKSTMALGRIF